MSTKHLQTTTSEFLQKDIGKFKEFQTNENTKKIHVWNRVKQTHIPVTITEDLAATDKGEGYWLILKGNFATDVREDSKCNSV